MKYTASIEIALPREKVLDLLSDPVHLPKWLRGVVVHEPLNGEHGQYGTESRVVMQMGEQTMEATEIVTRREPENLQGIPADSVVYYERELVGVECGMSQESGCLRSARKQRSGKARMNSNLAAF